MAFSHPRSRKAREPPPSLFLHPSPAASHVSLPTNPPSPTSAAAPGSQPPSSSQQTIPPPLSRNGSSLNPARNRTNQAPPPSLPTAGSNNNNLTPAAATTTPSLNPGVSNVSSSGGTGGGPLIPRLYTGESTRATDRTDALWAEMQATLEEVELSASTSSGAGGGTRVFGQEHDGKLALLRAAQVSLAQAWTRSEEATGSGGGGTVAGAAGSSAENEVRNLKGALADIGVAAAGVGLAGVASLGGGAGSASGGGVADVAGKAAAASAGVGVSSAASAIATGAAGMPASMTATGEEAEIGGGRPGSSGGPGVVGGGAGDALGAKLEEETENDLFLARKRREANDEYFRRVELGVQDVVSKLEEVASAMRVVEEETREIWGDESAPPSAKG